MLQVPVSFLLSLISFMADLNTIQVSAAQSVQERSRARPLQGGQADLPLRGRAKVLFPLLPLASILPLARLLSAK